MSTVSDLNRLSIFLWPVHYGKQSGTRPTFIFSAKISSFVEVLGFHVKVERYRDILKHISHQLMVKKSSLKPLGIILKEASREHAGSICLVFYSAVRFFPRQCGQYSIRICKGIVKHF